MINSGLDNFFQGVQGSSGSSGFLGSLMGMLGSSAYNSATGSAGASSSYFPKTGQTVNWFAKGGAFTNGVYNNPTMFKFANGGSFGVMGEAGPEAVMPLHRGPDGSLGVRVQGGGSNDNVTVNVYNNGNSKATVQERRGSQGREIDVIIDEMVADKLGEPGTMSNRALTQHNNRKLIRRG